MSKAKVSDPAPDELALLPLDKLAPSGLNPRKTFEPAAIEELAKSIREKGVLEPIIARPREVGYQIVAGERRVRAARLAGLQVIPAIVRDLDDKAAAEVAIIENDQRVDVPPLEQAEGYEQLIRLGDDTETIAAKIGRPVKYVVGRLQLTHLVNELKEDLRTGKLPFGHAWLLSKLPPAEQTELREDKYNGLYDYDGQVIPLDALKHEIKSFFGCLSAAPWKKDDEQLLPAAGACTKCHKRAGANPTLFDEFLEGEKKGRDLCTDRGCYAQKREAFVELQLRKSAEANDGQAVKVSTSWSTSGKDVLAKGSYEVVTAKEAKSAKEGTVQTAVVVSGPEDVGKLVHVKVKKQPKASSSSSRSSDESWKKERAAQERQAKIGALASVKANAAVAEKAEQLWDNGTTKEVLPVLRQLAAQLVREFGWNGSRAVARRRGLKVGVNNSTHTEALAKIALACDSPAELFGLLAELTAATVSDDWSESWRAKKPDNKQDLPFWKAFGIDPAKLAKDAEKEAAPEPEPTVNGKPKKKPKRKAVAAK